MNKKNLNEKGFTLIELIVVIAILGVIIAVAAPSYVGHVAKTRRQVCASNVDTLMRSYNYQHTSDETCTLEEFLAGKTPVKVSDVKCPDGGVYSVVNNNIVCSVHGEHSADEGTSTPVGNVASNLAFTDINGISVYASGDWAAFKQQAANDAKKNGAMLAPGTVYKDETGTYVVKTAMWISSDDARNNIALAAAPGLQKLDTNIKILTDSDYDKKNSKWITAPTVGTLYSHNNELYIAAATSLNVWTSNKVNSADWIKLKDQTPQ